MQKIDEVGSMLDRLQKGQIGIVPSRIGYLVVAATRRGVRRMYRAKAWDAAAPAATRKICAVVQDVGQIIACSRTTPVQREALVTLLSERELPLIVMTRARREHPIVMSEIGRKFIAPNGIIYSVWNIGSYAASLGYEALASRSLLLGSTANVSRQSTLDAPPLKTHFPHRHASIAEYFRRSVDFIIDGDLENAARYDGRSASIIDLTTDNINIPRKALYARQAATVLARLS